MARPEGTGKEYQEAVKIVENMFSIKSWTNDYLNDALKVLKEMMLDKDTSDNTRKGIAENLIKLHAFFYKEQEGVADPEKYKKSKKKKDDKPTEFMSLKFNGTED